jgi:hypothetical protein
MAIVFVAYCRTDQDAELRRLNTIIEVLMSGERKQAVRQAGRLRLAD